MKNLYSSNPIFYASSENTSSMMSQSLLDIVSENLLERSPGGGGLGSTTAAGFEHHNFGSLVNYLSLQHWGGGHNLNV